MGKPVFAMLASLIRDLVCFVPLIITFPMAFGIEGILWAAPVADSVAILVTAGLTVAFFVGLRKREKARKAEESTEAREETEAGD